MYPQGLRESEKGVYYLNESFSATTISYFAEAKKTVSYGWGSSTQPLLRVGIDKEELYPLHLTFKKRISSYPSLRLKEPAFT